MRRLWAIAPALLLLAPAPAGAWEPLEGALHEHSAWSDGWPGTRPADFYASGRAHGLDFVLGSDHSDDHAVPVTASEGCAQDPVACVGTDPDQLRKWEATGEQADAATDDAFVAVRGFEWTSDRVGHVNAYFSRHVVNAKTDGGYVTERALYDWAVRPASLGGGSDALLTFNHPGDKCLAEQDPACDWHGFRLDERVDRQVVGLELFNGTGDYGRHFWRALDAGWHVGAVGAEDLGHDDGDLWGRPDIAKTVVLADARTRAALREALLARRAYAVRERGVRLSFTVDGAPMGSRLDRDPAAPVRVRGSARDADGTLLAVDLVTTGGRVVRTDAGGTVDERLAVGGGWVVLRARRGGGEPVAYSSPVWLEGAAAQRWLAGDLHVHSCFSHDVFCGPTDDNTGPEEVYTLGERPGARFLEAAARGLDVLAITDHNDTRSAADPDFGAGGVVGLPGYEASVDGHAQVLGSATVRDAGDRSAADVRRLQRDLRDDGGLLQANHPGYRSEAPFAACEDTDALHWRYGYDVVPDSIEVLNPTSPVSTAEAWLECWLERGEAPAVTGGSDSHWVSLAAVGMGHPTTWALGRARSGEAYLGAVRAGRTAVSKLPPSRGGAPLLLEADADRDGRFEALQGDEVPGGSPMRVRGGGAAGGVVTVRGTGRTTVVDRARLTPGGVVRFAAPPGRGWVRARLDALPGVDAAVQPGCATAGQAIASCADDQGLLALTSAVRLR